MNHNSKQMEGVTIIHDQTNNKKYVQIALDKLEEYQEAFEDLFDAIIAESRKGDATISLSELKERLKLSGKL